MRMKAQGFEVTIIVPCYNSENYIRRTMDSICNQSFSDYEVVVVNDGSTDETPKILREYCDRFDFVRVITKQNDRGRTTFRKGLEAAKGRFVCVVDNDDIIDEDYVKKLYEALINNDADMAVCGFQRENRDKNIVYSKEMIKQNSVRLEDDFGVLLEINTSLWNKMVKREIYNKLLEAGDRFFGIDMIYLAYIYPYVKRIAFVPDVLYYYQIRESSGIHTQIKEYLTDVYDKLLLIRQEYEDVNREMLEFLNAFAFLHIGVSLLYRIYQNDKEEFKEFYSENLEYLNHHFSKWLSNKYVSLKYVVRKRRNKKLYICKIFYRVHMFKLFLAIYSFLIKRMRIEIKW